jgi:serine phosphatase RsbU (regulator of sigma subunit)
LLGQLTPGREELIGYAPLSLRIGAHRETGERATPLYVLVHRALTEVLAPVEAQLGLMAALGGIVVLVFIGIGIDVARRHIIDPLRLLDRAARAIAGRATLGVPSTRARDRASPSADDPKSMIEQVERIHTEDEIEDLSEEFALMARRVLNYHQHIETEIERRMRDDERELRIAREFQWAMLPSRFPQVPAPGANGATVSLEFANLYKSASTLGGDFFDVMALGEHQAGVFLADVMGHGVRSALITAMLRAIVQSSYRQANGPADLLERVNRQFKEIIPGDDEVIFASAVYLILDTRLQRVTCASAGHPSPLWVNSAGRRAEPLLRPELIGPAMGIFPEAEYQDFSRSIRPGDLFVVFTDGIIEASNPLGEEYGIERLKAMLELLADRPPGALCEAILEALHTFMSTVVTGDDLCLIGTRVNPPRPQ